jgi:hypothetical protein
VILIQQKGSAVRGMVRVEEWGEGGGGRDLVMIISRLFSSKNIITSIGEVSCCTSSSAPRKGDEESFLQYQVH